MRILTIGALYLAVLVPQARAQSVGDTTALSATRAAFVAAVRSKDGTAMSRITVPSIVMIRGQPGQFPVVTGRSAFEDFWKEAFSRTPGPNPYVLYPGEVRISDSVGIEVGEFGPEGQPPFGRYVLLYVWTADGWRITYWNPFRNP